MREFKFKLMGGVKQIAGEARYVQNGRAIYRPEILYILCVNGITYPLVKGKWHGNLSDYKVGQLGICSFDYSEGIYPSFEVTNEN